MVPAPYDTFAPDELMSLCVWREARGEPPLGRTGVAWVILNRADHPNWWGNSIETVVLKPFQFSSFNSGDPNSTLWPTDTDQAYAEIYELCNDVLAGFLGDPTGGAQYYHDVSIPEPQAWVDAKYQMTLEVGRLRFYKEQPLANIVTDIEIGV